MLVQIKDIFLTLIKNNAKHVIFHAINVLNLSLIVKNVSQVISLT